MILPSFFIVKSFEWNSIRPVLSSESRSGIVHQFVSSGHRFDSRMRLEVNPRDTRAARAFLFGLQENGSTLEYSDPDWQTSITGRLAQGTSPGGLVRGNNQFSISSTTGVQPGMMFNFSNHGKMYMIRSLSGTNVTFMPEYIGPNVATTVSLVIDSPVLSSEIAPDLRRSPEFAQRLMREESRINLRLVESI